MLRPAVLIVPITIVSLLALFQNCDQGFKASIFDRQQRQLNNLTGSSQTFSAVAGKATCALSAVNNPKVDASAAITSCLNSGLKDLILIPGRYFLKSRLTISNISGISIKTQGLSSTDAACRNASDCAELFADDSLVDGPLLRSDFAQGLVLDHVIISGNRIGRLARYPSFQSFWLKSNAFNAQIHGCNNCRFLGITSQDAVRGTGLEFSGDGAIFERVLFRNNGQGVIEHPDTNDQAWADGLTVHSSVGIQITNSEFLDNSDVNLIVGHAPNAVIKNNVLRNSNNFAFASLMLDNFDASTGGIFDGAVISGNSIDCSSDSHCGIGIDLGPWLWYQPNRPIMGGSVTANTVLNARIGISIYGVRGMSIFGNSIVMNQMWGSSDGKCLGQEIDVWSPVNGMINEYSLDRSPSVDSLRPCIGNPLTLAKMVRLTFNPATAASTSTTSNTTPTNTSPTPEPIQIDTTASGGSASISSQIRSAYLVVLAREPDLQGGLSWTSQISRGTSIQSIVKMMTESPEFVAAEPMDNTAFVRFLYLRLLSREPDSAGATSHIQSLNNGVSRQSLINVFLSSNEFKLLHPELQ